jgi:hypothetical protein
VGKGGRWEKQGARPNWDERAHTLVVCMRAIPVTVLENFNKRESPKLTVYVCLSFWECPDKEWDRKMYRFLQRCR